MQLIRTILIILAVYYLFRLTVRYALPLIAKYFIKKATKQYQDQYQKPQQKKEGEVSINYKPDNSSKLDDLGEYVDFKEVKDESY
jgi:hypothetical protein